MSKVYIDEGGIKQLYQGLSTCTGDNSLTEARRLSPCTDRRTIVITISYHLNKIPVLQIGKG